MKLRLQGNALRLRISQSEMKQFVETGRLENTVYFGLKPAAEFTYALVRGELLQSVDVESSAQRVTILLPGIEVEAWANTEQIGIEGEIDLGVRGILSILVEKDFACLDGKGEANADTFPNPLAAHAC